MNTSQIELQPSELEQLLKGQEFPAALQTMGVAELAHLSGLIRQRILEVTSQVGGHLASSLGSVELTVALYHVFNPTQHIVVWDVGHQGYAHKILTGRNGLFNQIGQRGGVAKFLRRAESPYDYFGAGHASTSISASLGMAIANGIKNNQRRVIAVIGDGAMTGGLAFEAMNQLGHLQKNLLVILNDNAMSISKNVGALSKTFNLIQTHKFYNELRSKIKSLDQQKKIPSKLYELVRRTNSSFMDFLSPKGWVEALDLRYLGPFDGHNLPLLVSVLGTIEKIEGPVLLHLRTVKGKGFHHAEKNSLAYHGVTKFSLETGEMLKKADGKAFTKVWAEAFNQFIAADPLVTGISAAMIESVGLKEAAEKFPDRVFDVGIAEAHAVCMAAGMASQGLKPFVAIYSTFLQRAFDQLIHDVALQNLPVRFILDRAGFVGADGATHNGVFDLSFLRLIPNFVIMAPRNAEELVRMAVAAYLYNLGPIALRYPRGETQHYPELSHIDFEQLKTWACPIGKGEIVEQGHEVAILSIGTMFETGQALSLELKKAGIQASLVDMKFVKPLDTELLLSLALSHKFFITIEENTKMGGFGSAILEFFSQLPSPPRVFLAGVEDHFVEYGTLTEQRDEAGLASVSIKNNFLANYLSNTVVQC